MLKIDRLESSELKIYEDSTIYREDECADLLKRLDEGNKKTGGLKLVTACYGIVGMLYVQDYTLQKCLYIYIYILSFGLVFSFRVCQISGALLHAAYNKKKEDW